jgi:hypothetical protein
VPVLADAVGAVEVRQHEDVEQLGEGSGAEGGLGARVVGVRSSSGLMTAGYASTMTVG